ncbi:MAG: DUF3179 domain-containing (seleno)protein [Lutibacter sp.]
MKFLFTLFGIFLLLSCNTSSDNLENNSPINNSTTFEWTVPLADLTGSDNPFPLALNPNYTLASDVNFINDDNKVALISFSENEVFAYPYIYISTYEIINDEIAGNKLSLTYCPITESAVVFKRDFNATDTFVLRSSGYLYKENLVAIDQTTQTYWSQFLLKSIKGKYQEQVLQTFNMVETNWKTVKEYFPNAFVFTNTSVQNKTKRKQSEKTSIDDNEVVFGFLENFSKNTTPTVHVYQYSNFNQGIELKTSKTSSENALIIGSSTYNFIVSYVIPSGKTFTALQNKFPIVMKDNQENEYNLFGLVVSGPNVGFQLESPKAFAASFWAWESFYSSIIIEE